MMASEKEPAAPREGQTPARPAEGDHGGLEGIIAGAPEAASELAEVLRRRLVVMRAYLGIIG
jgi:hypothetical protein